MRVPLLPTSRLLVSVHASQLAYPTFLVIYALPVIACPQVGCLLANASRGEWSVLVPLDFSPPPAFLAALLAPFAQVLPQPAAAGQAFGGGALCCWPWGPREWLSAFQLTEWGKDRAQRCGTRRRILAFYGALSVEPDPLSVLFVRRSGTHRRLTNLEALVSQCNSELRMRCETADLDDARQPFAERLRRLRRASALIGVHGAAMTNAVFMRPTAIAIEIFPCAPSNWTKGRA